MEIRVAKLENEIRRKVPDIDIYDGLDFVEYEVTTSHIVLDVYAPERGGDFQLSFSINFESDKPKKRRKQIRKLIENYLNVEQVTWHENSSK